MGKIGLPLAEGSCSSTFDCHSNIFSKVCCDGSCSSESCLGDFCLTDGDCGGKDECCISNKCTTYGCSECESHSDCGSSEYCCKHRYTNDHNVCRRSCVGETCHSSSDCAPREYCPSSKICWEFSRSCSTDSDCRGDHECCKSFKCGIVGCPVCTSNSDCSSSAYCCTRDNVCLSSCVGEKCYDDSDCGGPQEYCNSNTTKCEKSVTTLAGWVIPVVVVGIILFLIVVGAVWGYRCCHGSSRRGVVVRERPVRRTAAIIAIRETEIRTTSPPAHNYPPPSYYNQGQEFPLHQNHQLPTYPQQGMAQPHHFPQQM